MTKDDMTTPIPRDELAPILEQALRWSPSTGHTRVITHSTFTTKELHRVVDSVLVQDYPKYHVHEQTVRQCLKEGVAGTAHVYSRDARDGEHPTAKGPGHRVILYSLTSPVPVWDPEFSHRLHEKTPPPRVIGRLRRQRAKTSTLVNETISRWQDDAQEEKSSSRAELICTLVRELVTDSVSVDTLQARDDEIRALKQDVSDLKAQLKASQEAGRVAERKLKRIQSALGESA